MCSRCSSRSARHQDPVLEVLDADLLRHRREVLGVPYVRLGEGHPAVGPLPDGLLLGLFLILGPGDVELYHARHLGGVLVRPAGPLLELLHQVLYLLVGGADGDDAVAELARPTALYGTRCGHVDRGRRIRHGVEPRALELYVLAAVLDDLAREEPADDLDGLHQDAQPGRRLGPVIADDVFVQRLARAESEPEASRVHRFERRRSLGDYGRMVAEARRRHARAEAEVRGRAKSAHPGPDEGALALIRGPGVEVIRGHHGTEPRLFGRLTPIQKIRGMELLEHRRIANGARGFHVASFVVSISGYQASALQLLFGQRISLVPSAHSVQPQRAKPVSDQRERLRTRT